MRTQAESGRERKNDVIVKQSMWAEACGEEEMEYPVTNLTQDMDMQDWKVGDSVIFGQKG